ncbi:MAG TPA: DUF1015 domain-containing protein [Flavobacteriales bacterium]|jgi:uncharacterized protein (DUF1015 family)|nr:DUF1015 domain-containing protein [Flavobacteriales bacterium]
MIGLRPFRAWRPVPDKAHLVPSRSYVSYSEEQLRDKLAANPFSYLHIIHPDHGKDAHLTRDQRFDRVRQKFNEFVGDGWFIRDERPSLYLYEQSRPGSVSRGIIGAIGVGDYRGGRVKVHEQTLQAREELFKEYLNTTGVNAEPVLLAAPGAHELDEATEELRRGRPTYDFTTTDRIRHRLWAISDPATIAALQEKFLAIDALYIADGHHRFASSARLAEAVGAFGDHPKAWCLAFVVPEEHLHIHNFDRAVTSLGGMDTDEVLQALGEVGALQAMDSAPAAPPPQGSVYVFTRKGWYHLQLPAPGRKADASDRLDASVLSDAVLGPVLGIHDLRTDPHVKFIPGTMGTAELERLVRSGEAAVAFHLRPVSFEELKAVADSGGCMPPKSTYIEPKLRSGLTVYPLED